MDLIKCIAVIFLMDTVSRIKDIKLNNLKLETVSKLLNLLSKYGSNIKYIHVQPNVKNKKIFNKIKSTTYNDDNEILKDLETDKRFVKPKYIKKKILIKRLVPHGLPPGNLEYDAKYKTIYRPLIRIHKRKPLPNIKVILNANGNKNYDVDKYGIDIHDYYDNDENIINFVTKNEFGENLKNVKHSKNGVDIDEELLQPFANHLTENKVTNEASSQLRVLQDIEQILKIFRARPVRAETLDKIAKILNEIKNLRTYEKSGEDNDPNAPGRHYQGIIVEESTPKPKKPVQHYPPWNYWTYKKTIHQDPCPKGQVKINDRCIWLPPH